MLTDLKVRNAKPELKGYKLYDQGGLFLLVSPTGIRHWRFRYQFQKKSRELSLGRYPAIGLASARLAHLSLRGQIAHGIDPLLERQRLELVSSSEKKVREETFGKAVIRYLRSKEHGWSETHRRDVNRIFEKELLPQIGPKQISEISKRDIKAVIDRIVARDALTYVRDVVAYYGAVIRHYNSYSDVEVPDYSISLRAYLPSKPRERHHAALPIEQLGEFMTRLRHSPSAAQIRIGLELLILTLVRTSELRGATWNEFDLVGGVWNIPAERMKNSLPHRVPLSNRARALIHELQRLNGGHGYLLRNERTRGKPISENTFLYSIYRLGYGGVATPHGFRAVASSTLNSHGFHADAIERQLAHVEGNRVRAAYDRADHWGARVEMLAWWADFLAKAEAMDQKLPFLKLA